MLNCTQNTDSDYLNIILTAMRLKLTLKPEKQNQVISLNYYYYLSAWIYKKIQQADTLYADFLHNKGYTHKQKTFKFFTFSSLQISRFQIAGNRLTIQCPYITLYLSFLVDKTAESFIMGVFQDQVCEIADSESKACFQVTQVELVPLALSGDAVLLRPLSPLVVAKKVWLNDKQQDEYLSPTHEDFAEFFAENLISKYLTACEHFEYLPLSQDMPAPTVRIIDANRLRRKGITVKGNTDNPIKVIGYENFTFELSAPRAMIEVGLLSGFGRYNASGMGMCEGSERE